MARDATTPGRRHGKAAARRASSTKGDDEREIEPKAATATPVPEPAPAPAPEPAEPEDDLLRVVEAMLFAAHESLSARRIARAIGFVTEARIGDAIATLARRCDAQKSPLMLAEIAGGWRLVTRPEYAPFLARLFSKAEKERLSQAALETLAIVAYRQPATRAEIEAVRGVLVGPLLRVLQERRLIKVVGRAEVVGRPMQYGTTKRFLDHFGLASIADLPKVFPMGRPAPAAEGAADGAGDEAGTAEALATENAAATPAPHLPPPRLESDAETDAAPVALAANG